GGLSGQNPPAFLIRNRWAKQLHFDVTAWPAPISLKKGRLSSIFRHFSRPMRCTNSQKKVAWPQTTCFSDPDMLYAVAVFSLFHNILFFPAVRGCSSVYDAR
ncbi:MAG TPA: hypothetical protein PK971_08160, partial [Saprospiraceae bacterium]|nr:hypothetical protein [Saprospiraceae bacterium]